ncbi:MAG: AAC(3) family N-acetyltransferase [Lachnospiraceae bacterium]|nr:AAC(3) family N-acetyltransferase [Lachnospiraceae bacterium]
MKFDYTREDVLACLRKIGVLSGDNLFLHTNIGFFGRMEKVSSADELCEGIYSALKEAVTPEGTVVLPTFSASFFHNEIYDPAVSSTDCGLLSEYALKQSDTIRSYDPNFSVTAWGRLAEEYTKCPAHESFGKGSFWDRFLESGGKLVCMNYDCGSTFVHFAERMCSVPYRYNKAFNGTIRLPDGTLLRDYAVHYVFEGEKDYPTFDRLDRKCRERGICHTADLGRGTVLAIDIKQYYALICECIKEYPRFLTAGG